MNVTDIVILIALALGAIVGLNLEFLKILFKKLFIGYYV